MLVFYATDDKADRAREIAGSMRVFIRNPRHFNVEQGVEGDGALVLAGSPQQQTILDAYHNRGLFAERVRDRLPNLPAGVAEGQPAQEDRLWGKSGKVFEPEPTPKPKPQAETKEPSKPKLEPWKLKTPPSKYRGKKYAALAQQYIEAGRPGG